MAERKSVDVDGRRVELDAASTLASALVSSGISAIRRSAHGEARGPVCGMGSCYECRCTIDGAEQERACLRSVESVSRVESAASSAERAGVRSASSELLVDENPGLGGQIWRADRGPESSRAREAVRANGVEVLVGANVVLALDAHRLRLATRDAVIDARFTTLVLATGATELLLPFPGWTLPNVFGLGGLQALAKGGLDLRGKRVVLAGSGPLLLAVADVVARKGANVLRIAEQASRGALASFAVGLATRPSKLGQALGFAGRLGALRTSSWPVEARGRERLEELVVRTPSGDETLACDFAGVGFGLVPNGRLAALLGCALDGRRVRVDGEQRTSVAHVFAAGECTGVGERGKRCVLFF